MASYIISKTLAILALALALCVQGIIGVFLPKLCETRGENVRRGLAKIKSSGYVAPGPKGVHPVKYMVAPMVAPAPGGVHPVKYKVAPMVALAPY